MCDTDEVGYPVLLSCSQTLTLLRSIFAQQIGFQFVVNWPDVLNYDLISSPTVNRFVGLQKHFRNSVSPHQCC